MSTVVLARQGEIAWLKMNRPEALNAFNVEMAAAMLQSIDRLAAVPTDRGFVLHEIFLLRLRALLARAHGDEAAYREFADRYRVMATSLGFEGHMKWAEAMP